MNRRYIGMIHSPERSNQIYINRPGRTKRLTYDVVYLRHSPRSHSYILVRAVYVLDG